jgi:hypothetical protein
MIELTQPDAFGDIGLRRGSEFAAKDAADDLAVVEHDYH